MCPPAINALQIQCDLGHELTVMSYNMDGLSSAVKKRIIVKDLGKRKNPSSKIQKYWIRLKKRKEIRDFIDKHYMEYDLIWLTSEIAVREVGKILLKTKYIMQLMEMVNYVPQFGNCELFKFDIKKYAQNAMKVVVPEENRAYITQVRWELKNLPSILPNKPYDATIDFELSDNAKSIIDILKKEKRKIILYQGGFTEDRRFEEFAEAVDKLGSDYVFYLMGFQNDYCKKILDKYPSVKYLGALNPPEHLVAAQYAYLGVLTYLPVKAAFYSELNALYCAPNKIFEYALCGLPMIGTNVLGLKYLFEKYNIGKCCKELTAESICETVQEIEKEYNIMKSNCRTFYDSVDMVSIMKEILQ